MEALTLRLESANIHATLSHEFKLLGQEGLVFRWETLQHGKKSESHYTEATAAIWHWASHRMHQQQRRVTILAEKLV